MSFVIAILFAVVAFVVLVALVKIAFSLIMLAIVLGLGVGAYLLVERVVGKGR